MLLSNWKFINNGNCPSFHTVFYQKEKNKKSNTYGDKNLDTYLTVIKVTTVQVLAGEKKILFHFWVVIWWLPLTFEFIHFYAMSSIHELIHHVWSSLRLNDLIAVLFKISASIHMPSYWTTNQTYLLSFKLNTSKKYTTVLGRDKGKCTCIPSVDSGAPKLASSPVLQAWVHFKETHWMLTSKTGLEKREVIQPSA